MSSITKLYPITTASDCAAYVELSFQGFRDGLMSAMYPISKGGFSTAARVDLCGSLLPSSETQAETSPQTILVKAVDPTLEASQCDPMNGIVAIAKWVFYPSRSAELIDAQLEQTVDAPAPVDADAEFTRAWRQAVEGAKRDTMGLGAYVYLSVLITRVGFQRKGIGRQMMQWGTREADQSQLPIYLESTPAGQALYEKGGFVACGRLPFDATPWTDGEGLEHVLMVRPAQKSVYMNGNGQVHLP